MSVKVTRGRVDTGERVYFPGEVILGLRSKEEQELVDLKVCEWVGTSEPALLMEQHKQEQLDELPAGLTKLKGGFFGLPDGSKVRGKEKALEALEFLQNPVKPTGLTDSDVGKAGDLGTDPEKDEDQDTGPANGEGKSEAPATNMPGLDVQ